MPTRSSLPWRLQARATERQSAPPPSPPFLGLTHFHFPSEMFRATSVNTSRPPTCSPQPPTSRHFPTLSWCVSGGFCLVAPSRLSIVLSSCNCVCVLLGSGGGSGKDNYRSIAGRAPLTKPCRDGNVRVLILVKSSQSPRGHPLPEVAYSRPRRQPAICRSRAVLGLTCWRPLIPFIFISGSAGGGGGDGPGYPYSVSAASSSRTNGASA